MDAPRNRWQEIYAGVSLVWGVNDAVNKTDKGSYTETI
jgi:hypothetical protein